MCICWLIPWAALTIQNICNSLCPTNPLWQMAREKLGMLSVESSTRIPRCDDTSYGNSKMGSRSRTRFSAGLHTSRYWKAISHSFKKWVKPPFLRLNTPGAFTKWLSHSSRRQDLLNLSWWRFVFQTSHSATWPRWICVASNIYNKYGAKRQEK
jgi:hypothetical protein